MACTCVSMCVHVLHRALCMLACIWHSFIHFYILNVYLCTSVFAHVCPCAHVFACEFLYAIRMSLCVLVGSRLHTCVFMLIITASTPCVTGFQVLICINSANPSCNPLEVGTIIILVFRCGN